MDSKGRCDDIPAQTTRSHAAASPHTFQPLKKTKSVFVCLVASLEGVKVDGKKGHNYTIQCYVCIHEPNLQLRPTLQIFKIFFLSEEPHRRRSYHTLER